jgi:hypothetical protein
VAVTSDEDPRAAVMVLARARVRGPARALAFAGAAHTVAAIVAYAVAKLEGAPWSALAAIALVAPGPILVAAGWQLVKIRGWNLIFGGLMGAVGLWLLAAIVFAYEGRGVWGIGALAGVVVAFVLVVPLAGLAEDGAVRAARAIVDPPKPRDPADRGPF